MLLTGAMAHHLFRLTGPLRLQLLQVRVRLMLAIAIGLQHFEDAPGLNLELMGFAAG